MQFEELLMKKQKQGREEGIKEGITFARNSLTKVLAKKGNMSCELEKRIKLETDLEVLEKWFDIALAVLDTDEFEKEILCK